MLNWLMGKKSQLKFPLPQRLKLKRLARAHKGTESDINVFEGKTNVITNRVTASVV